MKKFIFSLAAFISTQLLFANPDTLSTNSNTTDIREIFTFQVSFLPGVGTNGLESSNYTNYLSFNIIAGYNGGVEVIELGGFSNTIKMMFKAFS